MNTLVKLVKTDLYKLRSIGVVVYLYLALIVLFALDMRTVFVGYMIVFYMLLYAPMAYDEASRGMHMLCLLPVTRKQVVQAKFLYAIAVIVGIDLIVTVVSSLSGLFMPSSVISAIPALPYLSLLGVMFSAVVLPAVLYFGVTKARFLVMGVYIFGIVLWTLVFNDGFLISKVPKVTGFGALVLTVILLGASYFISCKLFEKREFTE